MVRVVAISLILVGSDNTRSQTADGPKYRYIYGKTRKAVAERLRKAIADRDGGLIFDAGNVTVGEYWTAGYRIPLGTRYGRKPITTTLTWSGDT